jgi:RNA polymerase primary sigma factor
MEAESKRRGLEARGRKGKSARAGRVRQRSPQRRRLVPPGDALDRYFRELQDLPLLDASQELALAREIERLELEHWGALLGYRPALDTVACAVESRLREAAPTLARLRGLARTRRAVRGSPRARRRARAVASAAQQLRQLDFARAALREADAAVQAAFASDGRARAYLTRVTRAKTAEERAKGRFVAANLRLVIAMTRRYDKRLLPRADLIQEGNLGLMRAVERFDHRRGYRFSTYASWWIRHSLNRALSDKARLVRVPVHALDEMTRLTRARSAAMGATGGAPSTEELAEQLGISPAKVELLESGSLVTPALSLDRQLSAQRDRTLHDLLPAAEQPDPVEACDRSAWSAELTELLGSLTGIEAAVLRLRFGLGGGEELTLREVGLKYNLSRERIRQIQDEALAKLRGTLRRRRARGGDRSAA